jgi:hypothetical protein
MENREFSPEQEARKFEVSNKVQEMIQAQISVREIAAMFKAEEFLEETGRGKTRGLHLKFGEFVDSLVKEEAKIKLPQKVFKTDDVFLPPDEGELRTGSGEGLKETETIPRSKYLMEVLAELDQEYILGNGENDPNMMRELSYQTFIIPKLEKVVMVNNEEGNATFIYHNDTKDEEGNERIKFSEMTEEELIRFGEQFAERHSKKELKAMEGSVSILIYPGSPEEWKDKIREIFLKPIEKVDISEYENKVIGEQKDTEEASEGWMTANALIKPLEIGRQKIKKEANKYRKSNPEWFKNYKIKGRTHEHFSPELIEKIREEIESVEDAPDGWITSNALSKQFGVGISHFAINKEANKYRKSNHEWFKIHKDSTRKKSEHFSPELVERIREEIESIEEALEGWMTISTLSKLFSVADNTIKKEANKYRKSNPDGLKIIKSKEELMNIFHLN